MKDPPMTDSVVIEKVAQLAKIGLTPQEVQDLRKDLARMMEFLSTLGKVPTEGVSPLVNPASHANSLRPDVLAIDATATTILQNAPLKEQDMFLVPKIVEGG